MSTNEQEITSSTPEPAMVAKAVEKSRIRAEEYVRDPHKAKYLLDIAGQLLKNKEANKGSMTDVWAHLQILVRLFQAYIRGEYRDTPWGSLVMVVVAIIYFVSPIDFIPDVIPGFGQLDDVAVVTFVITQLKKDLDDFLAWESTIEVKRNA